MADDGAPVALTRAGHALAHLADDVGGGIALLDRALVLNPNLASAWFLAGFLRTWNGEPDAAWDSAAHRSTSRETEPEHIGNPLIRAIGIRRSDAPAIDAG